MIAIVLFTHAMPPEREEYAWLTINSLHRLQASEPFWFHLADDGSSQEFRDKIMTYARIAWGDNTSVTNSDRRGYGASYNISSQVVHPQADLILPLEDDWEMLRDFDLDPFARLLRAGVYRCIRMGYIGYTTTLRATFEYYENQHFLRLDPDSQEKHVFAGGPRLETRDFQRAVGAWPEELGAGHTELEVIKNPETRHGVAWPIEAIKPKGDLFQHVGGLKAGDGSPGSYSQMQEQVQ